MTKRKDKKRNKERTKERQQGKNERIKKEQHKERQKYRKAERQKDRHKTYINRYKTINTERRHGNRTAAIASSRLFASLVCHISSPWTP